MVAAVSRHVKLETRDVNVFYGATQALFGVNLSVCSGEILALIGPSGCGKSTFLRCLNRMNDVIDSCQIDGEILLDGRNIYGLGYDVTELRSRVGMVFQKPNPFPKSIYDNVAYAPRIHGIATSRSQLDEIVATSLKRAGLFDEVKDRLRQPALSLSGGQQQRLCIARAIAIEPEVLLMDEPCSSLDPVATARIEELMISLKKLYTIVIVTHSMHQASRVSDRTGFFLMGRLIELGPTNEIFQTPKDERTDNYIRGRFG